MGCIAYPDLSCVKYINNRCLQRDLGWGRNAEEARGSELCTKPKTWEISDRHGELQYSLVAYTIVWSLFQENCHNLFTLLSQETHISAGKRLLITTLCA